MKLKVIIILLALMIVLNGCKGLQSTSESTPEPQTIYQDENSTKDNSVIPDISEQNTITKIQYFDRDITGCINKHWLINELRNSQETESPDEVIALDMEISVTIDNGKEFILRLVNPIKSIFSIKSGDNRYTLKSEGISLWLDYLSNSPESASSIRGVVGEIDNKNNRFLLVDAVDMCDIWLTLSDRCNKNISDINEGNKIIVLLDGGITEEVPSSGRTSYIINDNYPQENDFISDVTSITDKVAIISDDGEFSEEFENQSNIIVMVSNQSFKKPNMDLKCTMEELVVFADMFECVTQHEYSYYYLKAEDGTYPIKAAGNGVESSTEITVSNDEKVWIAFTYWNDGDTDDKILFTSQNERIMID